MRTARLLVVSVLAVALGACASDALRPAPTPAEEAGPWGVAFTAHLPPDFWNEGTNGYRLVLECPEPVGPVGGPVVTLRVSGEAATVDGDVFLKSDGPGTGLLTPSDLSEVNPAQVMTPVISLVGLTTDQTADVIANCTGSFVVDGGETTPLEAGEPFEP